MKYILILIAFILGNEAFAQSFVKHSYYQLERTPSFSFSNKIYQNDLDNDGNLDFVTLNTDINIYNKVGDKDYKPTRLNKNNIGFDTYNDLIFMDYNNDGMQDIIIASYKILFLKNQGNLNFSLDTAIGIDTTAFHVFYSLTQIDVDNDGVQEIIASTNLRDRIFMIKRKSDGSYASPDRVNNVSISNDNIKTLEVLDIDQNGFQDFFFGLSSGYRAYMNDGKGNFTEKLYNQFSFGFADIDNDGDVDGLSYGANQLDIQLNNGSDQFTKLNIGTIINLGFAKFADIDGDGKIDIVCGRRYFRNDTAPPENLFYYKNNGDMTFTKIIIDNTINNNYEAPFVADLDNDSKLDLMIIDVNSETSNRISSIVTFHYKGNQQYQKDWLKHTGKYTFYDWADVNSDGLPDFVYAFGGNGKLFWLKNRGSFKFDKPRVVLDTLPYGTNYKVSFHFDDINNDGFNDVYGAVNNIEFLALNKGDHTFYPYQVMDSSNIKIQQELAYSGASDNFQRFQYTDINSDGIDDIIYSNYANSFYRYSLGNGKFSKYYTIPEIVKTSSRDYVIDLVVKDVNNDKINDLIYFPALQNDYKFMPYINHGNLKFTPDTLWSVAGYLIDALSMRWENNYIKFEDINNDSIPDILLNSKWLPSQPNGLYDASRLYINNKYNSPYSLSYAPEFYDLDNDGKRDMIIHSYNSLLKNDSLVFHKNIGNGFFDEKRNYMDNSEMVINPNMNRKRFLDLDNDGDIDVAFVSRNVDNVFGEMIILENKLNDNNTITIRCFWDKNGNKVMDQGEPILKNQKVYLNNTSDYAFTNDSGYAYFNLSPSVNKVFYKKNELWTLTTDSTYSITLPQYPIQTYLFGLKQNVIKDSIDVMLTASSFRCLRTSNLWLSVANVGNTEINGNDTLSMSTFLNFLSSNPPAQTITAHKKHWAINALNPSELKNILIDIQSPNTSINQDSVRIQNIFSGKSSHFTTNKTVKDSIIDRIRCSYDPNMKEVQPQGPHVDSLVLKYTPLEYTIYFQNTGNDTAYNIVIKDTISPLLDMSTFRLLANSHQVNVNIHNNIVTFTFKDINLVDSTTNELLSQGFVKFFISPNSNLSNHTVVINDASIYFDFNPAIVTNETVSIYVNQLPVSTDIHHQNNTVSDFSIYPNPANDIVHLEWNLSKPNSPVDIYIIDITGRVIQVLDNISENNLSFNTNQLYNGLYFISLVQNDKILVSKKLVIQ